MKGYKYTKTLVVTFKKPNRSADNRAVESATKLHTESESKIHPIYKKTYFNSKPKIIINDTDLEESLLKSNEEILNKIDVWISEGSGWTIESVDQHFINIAKYKPLKGSSYVKLPKELQHHSKGLIN